MVRTYRYRIYPTAKQAKALTEQLGAACDLYNAALEQRKRAYREHGVSLSCWDQYCELTQVRAAGLLPSGMSSNAQRDVLKRLDKGFAAFFRRNRAGETPGFPRFKSRTRYASLTWALGNGARLKDGRLRLRGVGAIRVRWHRLMPGDAIVRTATVKRAGGHWYLVLIADTPASEPLPPTGQSVGIDRGVTVPFALSTGELIQGPRAQKTGATSLRRAQRKVSRRRKGSHRRRKATVLLARQYTRQGNRRRDFLHKLSRRLVDENDTITFEDLNVRAMTSSARGTVAKPGRHVAQKRGLNREILDQGWARLVELTCYKAEWAGRDVILVPAPFTSQTCHECGAIDRSSRKGAVFRCTSCGQRGHADVNAARNIQSAGLALQALTRDEEVCVA